MLIFVSDASKAVTVLSILHIHLNYQESDKLHAVLIVDIANHGISFDQLIITKSNFHNDKKIISCFLNLFPIHHYLEEVHRPFWVFFLGGGMLPSSVAKSGFLVAMRIWGWRYSLKNPMKSKKINPPIIILFISQCWGGTPGVPWNRTVSVHWGFPWNGDSTYVCCYGNGNVQHLRGSARKHGAFHRLQYHKDVRKVKRYSH